MKKYFVISVILMETNIVAMVNSEVDEGGHSADAFTEPNNENPSTTVTKNRRGRKCRHAVMYIDDPEYTAMLTPYGMRKVPRSAFIQPPFNSFYHSQASYVSPQQQEFLVSSSISTGATIPEDRGRSSIDYDSISEAARQTNLDAFLTNITNQSSPSLLLESIDYPTHVSMFCSYNFIGKK